MPLREVIGQVGPVRLIARLIARDRLPHALLLEGLPGCGRRTMAVAIAQALLCPDSAAGDACGICSSCQLVNGGNHPDLTILPHDSQGEDLSVAMVRETVVEAAQQSALLGHRRVFILPGVERLNPAAGNALLKILEEPPAGVYLLMTTANAASVLRTIRSRAQLTRLGSLSSTDIEAILIRGGVPAALARMRAVQGGGSHRGLWQDSLPVPLPQLLALVRGGHDPQVVADIMERLPRKVSEEAGRTLAGEQRHRLDLWLQALVHELRNELRSDSAERTSERIERVLGLRHDLQILNIAPQMILEGLALGVARG